MRQLRQQHTATDQAHGPGAGADAAALERDRRRRAPTFTLEVAPVPGVDAQTARKLTLRAVCGALAEVRGGAQAR